MRGMDHLILPTIEPLIGGLILNSVGTLFWSGDTYWTPYRGIDTLFFYGHYLALKRAPIEPLIGGLIPIAHILVVHIQISIVYWTPYRGIDTVSPIHMVNGVNAIEPLIGGLKCSFAFLERGAVEELFTGLECGEWRVELKTFLTQTNISRFPQ